ncbi:MAG: hypothetical protein L0Z53_16185, partial [Acidobacteriales bacterium]|nr:hypothetical protein [Terriglobales bacterium]
MLLTIPRTLLASLAIVLASVNPSFPQADAASLTIRFAGGTSQFRVGEVIPIELSFTASLPDTYDISTRSYDRSGRLNIERFYVTPPGRDPLIDYYSEGAFIMGGLGGSRVLTKEPHIMEADLNEWVALDQPGHYTLHVTTRRVSRRGATKDEPIEWRSNSLEFDVIAAEPEWQQRTLAAAVSVLNDIGSSEESKTAAMRTLRFLDTPQSIHELVTLFDNFPGRFDCIGGLAGSRHQALVIAELEQQMSAPDIAITNQYLYILAKLKFRQERGPMPLYPKDDVQQQKQWQARMQSRQKEFSDFQEALFNNTAALVSTKQGRARAETVTTLLMRPARGAEDIKPFAALPDTEVASAFLALTADQQSTLLTSFWERLRLPAMVKPLQTIAGQPAMQHQLLRDITLQRLYELDPIEATPYILGEIRHPHVDSGMFTVQGKTLGVLPRATLPEFDEVLAARLAQKESRTLPLDAQLVGRYSTKAI